MLKFRSLLIAFMLVCYSVISYGATASCQQVTDDLNKSFNNIQSQSYQDSGVFVHSFDFTAYHYSLNLSSEINGASSNRSNMDSNNNQNICDKYSNDNGYKWCPNTWGISNGFISFSYLRKDIMPDTGVIIFPVNASQSAGVGIIFSNDHNSNIINNFQVNCFYPSDGMTLARYESGCGKAIDEKTPLPPEQQSQFCPDDLSVEKFFAQPVGNPPDASAMCSIKPQNFNFFIQVAKATNYDAIKKVGAVTYTDNEISIKQWNGSRFDALPTKAFFYVINAQEGLQSDLSSAKSMVTLFNTTVASEYQKCLCSIDYNKLKKSGSSSASSSSSDDINPFSCSMV